MVRQRGARCRLLQVHVCSLHYKFQTARPCSERGMPGICGLKHSHRRVALLCWLHLRHSSFSKFNTTAIIVIVTSNHWIVILVCKIQIRFIFIHFFLLYYHNTKPKNCIVRAQIICMTQSCLFLPCYYTALITDDCTQNSKIINCL